MHPKTSRLLLAVIPAVFAFFLAAVSALALTNSNPIANIVGVGAALSSTTVILKH